MSQQSDENPSAFLERLREVLIKHTPIRPDTLEGDIRVCRRRHLCNPRDKFAIQAAPDIHRKLQKLAIGPEDTIEQLLKIANTVFYNRDQEEALDKERKIKKKTDACGSSLGHCPTEDLGKS
ncbi:hypothetical protein mRhiFer1_009611 [Rhinolophus ferrumequinum]|uniref:Core shell protein Gag P30 domain-containing protein n=1 Tax=Rhinolophus ferrumequinum TaxID=59479 RepID=A0A7J7ZRU0_RHIFE|nr:hypothetical protein mRhiFer1_009611 [Rhinolophus ferrumequinum]